MGGIDRPAGDYDAMRRERDALRERLEEREADMHARVRAEYDATIAGSWRIALARVEAERRQLRARLVECRPWVGVCPIEPDRIREMCLVRDLADDTLQEVKR